MVIVARFQTDLGRFVAHPRDVYEDRILKILYDIATSPANDGKIGARFDTLYLGMAGLGHRPTKELVRKVAQRNWVRMSARGEYLLTAEGMREVLRRASPETLMPR